MSVKLNQQPPRLCHLVKQNSGQEYGFDLHSSKSRGGQFIGVVDNGSPAHLAGLLQNDRLVAVNGSPVQHMSHKEVVARIRQDPKQCYLTVQTLDDHRGLGHRGEWTKDDQEYEEEYQTKSLDLRPASSEESYDMGSGSKVSRPPLSPSNTSDQIPAHFDHSCSLDQDQTLENQGAQSSFNSEIVLRKQPVIPDLQKSISKPKWCRLMKKREKDDFGFNLIADKKRGYFLGKIDKKSIADQAGLREGLRLVGVNHQVVDLNIGYKDVVNLILKYPMHVTLMVVTEEVHQYFINNGLKYDFSQAEPLVPSENLEDIKMDESVSIDHNHNVYEPVTRKKDNRKHYSSNHQFKQQMSLELEKPRHTFTSTRPISLYAGSANNPNFVLSENFFRMSVAEVRELISKQKKVDPRNNALSLIERYNIVRNL